MKHVMRKVIGSAAMLASMMGMQARGGIPCSAPDPANPGKTINWTCADNQICGSLSQVHFCAIFSGYMCLGNTGWADVTIYQGSCLVPPG